MSFKRFGFGMVAIVLAALACRQQPGNDPKPAPNSPLPTIDRQDKDKDDTTTTSAPLPSLKRDGG